MRINLGILTFGAFSCFWGTGAGGAMGLQLVDFDDLKDLLGLEGSLITEYPALNLLRDSITVAFEEYLGRKLQNLQRTEVQYIGEQKKSMFYLEAIPVSAVSSVILTDMGSDSTLTENSDYYITDYGIKLCSNVNKCKISIIYTGGLEETTTALTRAALLQISYEFQNKEHIGADHVSTEGGSVSTPSLQLLEEVKRMINSERHPLKRGFV